MTTLPTYVDRYPAKMVSHLAEKLADRYVVKGMRMLDPFCGSGAILKAISLRNCRVTGFDVNPYATLLSRVKLDGFDGNAAEELSECFLRTAASANRILSIPWDAKTFWFTEATILKYEQLRFAAGRLDLFQSREGRAILLAYALSIRRCSRADQRSPKPFISKHAIKTRKGRHFDPYKEIRTLLVQLARLYANPVNHRSQVLCVDLCKMEPATRFAERFSHIITSPPYINAQDYFRNFKLELNLLEGLLPFKVGVIKYKFIGTERGNLIAQLGKADFEYHRYLLPLLKSMESTHAKQAQVVHRYLSDMRRSFQVMKACLMKEGKLVVVCGDNLVGGYRIVTWKVLSEILADMGFVLYERFGDAIERRHVPPKRNGHTGLIKQEVISAYSRKSQDANCRDAERPR